MLTPSLHLRSRFRQLSAASWPHRIFVLGMLLKGLDGILELAGGLFVLVTSLANLNGLIIHLTHHALTKNPNALIAKYLLNVGQHLSPHTKMLIALYLISHGVLKIFLVVSLLHHKRWAYPVASAIIVLFISYQSYVLSQNFTPELLLLICLDLAVLFLIRSEYHRLHRLSPTV